MTKVISFPLSSSRSLPTIPTMRKHLATLVRKRGQNLEQNPAHGVGSYSTTIGWTSMRSCTDIHDSLRMKPSDFGDPLTFPLVPLVFLSELSAQMQQNMIHNSSFLAPSSLNVNYFGLSPAKLMKSMCS